MTKLCSGLSHSVRQTYYMSSDDDKMECETEDDRSPFVREDAERVVDEALSDI